MKRLLSTLLIVVLLLSMTTTAFATETPPEPTIFSVGTMDELQTAVATAVDGDTIEVNQGFVLTAAISTDKQITITRASDYPGSTLLELRDNAVLDGFAVIDNASQSTIAINFSTLTPAVIQNCTFTSTGEQGSSCINISGNMDINKAVIENCSFSGSMDRAIKIMANTEVTVKGCTLNGGGISNSGKLTLENTSVTGGVGELGGGGVLNSGVLAISDCHIYGNTALNAEMGTDIHSYGTLSIAGTMTEGEGFYDEATGQKITLPISDYTTLTKLVYLTDEEAAERFAPPAPEPEPEPTPDPTPDPKPEPKPEPDDSDDDYTPPVHRPSKPDVITPAPAPTPTPKPVPATRTLACGNAVLDVSRSVALDGYSGGHADDYLTRAQLATILYHLLDTNTLAQYDTTANSFTDVPAAASYNRHVSTVVKAGIIEGVGNGAYNPNGRLTWAHALTVLTRFVESENYSLQNIKYDGWAKNAIQTAVAHDWIRDRADFKPNAAITLGEFVELLNGILGLYQTI